MLTGGLGNDLLLGNQGHDILILLDGNDTLNGIGWAGKSLATIASALLFTLSGCASLDSIVGWAHVVRARHYRAPRSGATKRCYLTLFKGKSNLLNTNALKCRAGKASIRQFFVLIVVFCLNNNIAFSGLENSTCAIDAPNKEVRLT